MTWRVQRPTREALLGILYEQYKSSPNIIAIIEAVAERADILDDVEQELYGMLDIATATGATLDLLGSLVNVPRNGFSDDIYRARILGTAGASRSGTPEDIIATIKFLTGSTSVMYAPAYPAGFWAVPGKNGDRITQKFLDTISPAGVQALPPCFLIDARGAAIVDAASDYILVVGPCSDVIPEGDYIIYDGGLDTTPPAESLTIIDGGIDVVDPDFVYDYGGGP